MTTICRWVLAACVMAAIGLTALAPAASAEDNGVSARPTMGWSSWDFLRHDPTEATVEAQAKAMVTSGLKRVGYRYINVDDYWYQCPGPKGPTVDHDGRWVVNSTAFPSEGSANGIEALARYVHGLGLKFGLYVTPGISKRAVAANTPILGTHDSARGIATTTRERNYNCGGMVGINYSKPGAQAFIDSWASELASWGVDYIKLDGVGSSDIADVDAWSRALRHTGRKIQLELSNSLSISDASTWEKQSNGWRTGGDIQCYCSSTSYPLTNWSNIAKRFNAVAEWAPYGHPGGFNDLDSVEVGNGSNDGLTPAERQAQMSLWALGSSPFILGTNLTDLDALDRSYLLNRAVIAVDQDGIDAHRIVNTRAEQVFTKTERPGDVIVGLFDTGNGPATLSTTTAALGLARGRRYTVDNLWSHKVSETAGRIGAEVGSHGVGLFKITPATSHAVPPLTTVTESGPTAVAGGDVLTERVSFTDDGSAPVRRLHLSFTAPTGWSVTPKTPVSAASVGSGQSISARFHVAVPQASRPFTTGTLTAGASGSSVGGSVHSASSTTVTASGGPVTSPFATYSSATDAPARFSQIGPQFGIEGAGASLYTHADDYSAIDENRAVSTSATVTAEVTGERQLNGYAKAGIMIRNDISASGTSPEGVVLYDSPGGGVQLEWDDNAGRHINSVTPRNGTIMASPPILLRLVRSGSTYTGTYSTNGTSWYPVGRATVPGQAATQDAGMFVVSDAPGLPGLATFTNFSVS